MIDRRAHLALADPAVYALILREVERQEHGLELIASENFATMAVMEAMGTALTNKYAEGLPKKRYYGGCEGVDEGEQLAIDRAKALFKTEHVNVQPPSGAQANMAASLTVAKPGDTLLGLSLRHGGHLTHGSPVNFSGTLFRATSYGVHEDTGRIDYDQARDVARHVPRLIVVDPSRVLVHAVRGGAEQRARKVHRRAVREVPSVTEGEAEQRVARLRDREGGGHVGLGARRRLDVDVLRFEQRFRAVDGELLALVHALATAVVALLREPLGVFVRERSPHRLHH